MSLDMGVVVGLWECKTGLKVASAERGQDGEWVIKLRGKEEGDPRTKELAAQLEGKVGYQGHQVHKTRHRVRDRFGGDNDTHTYYRGALKAKDGKKKKSYGSDKVLRS